MEDVRWKDLRRGDVIVCPGDGRAERVIYIRPYVTGKITAHTNRHDHLKRGTDTVPTERRIIT